MLHDILATFLFIFKCDFWRLYSASFQGHTLALYFCISRSFLGFNALGVLQQTLLLFLTKSSVRRILPGLRIWIRFNVLILVAKLTFRKITCWHPLQRYASIFFAPSVVVIIIISKSQVDNSQLSSTSVAVWLLMKLRRVGEEGSTLLLTRGLICHSRPERIHHTPSARKASETMATDGSCLHLTFHRSFPTHQ